MDENGDGRVETQEILEAAKQVLSLVNVQQQAAANAAAFRHLNRVSQILATNVVSSSCNIPSVNWPPASRTWLALCTASIALS